MPSQRLSRERRPSATLPPHISKRIDEVVAAAPPPTGEQIDTIRRIFEASADRHHAMADAGVCHWNSCGRPMTGWAIEEVEGAVPVCQGCVREFGLTLVGAPAI